MSEETTRPEFEAEELDDDNLEKASGGAATFGSCQGCDACNPDPPEN